MTHTLTRILASHPRRFRVGMDCGDVFSEGDDFDGWTLTVEIMDEGEAAQIVRALRKAFPDWQPSDDTDGGAQ